MMLKTQDINPDTNQDINQNNTGDNFYFVDNDKIKRMTDSVNVVERVVLWLLLLLIPILWFMQTKTSYDVDAELVVSLLIFISIAYVINNFIFRRINRLIEEVTSCLVKDKHGVLWKINLTELNKNSNYCFTQDTFKNPIIINQSRLSDYENIKLKASILRAIDDFKSSINKSTNKHRYIVAFNGISVISRTKLSYKCRYQDLNGHDKHIRIYQIYKEFLIDNDYDQIDKNTLKPKNLKKKKYHFHIITFKALIYALFVFISKHIDVFKILRDIIRSINN